MSVPWSVVTIGNAIGAGADRNICPARYAAVACGTA